MCTNLSMLWCSALFSSVWVFMMLVMMKLVVLVIEWLMCDFVVKCMIWLILVISLLMSLVL